MNQIPRRRSYVGQTFAPYAGPAYTYNRFAPYFGPGYHYGPSGMIPAPSPHGVPVPQQSVCPPGYTWVPAQTVKSAGAYGWDWFGLAGGNSGTNTGAAYGDYYFPGGCCDFNGSGFGNCVPPNGPSAPPYNPCQPGWSYNAQFKKCCPPGWKWNPYTEQCVPI